MQAPNCPFVSALCYVLQAPTRLFAPALSCPPVSAPALSCPPSTYLSLRPCSVMSSSTRDSTSTSFCPSGVPSTPHTYRGRAVFCVFWFACVILYASYTAGLTSALTVSTEGPPFTSLMGAVDVYPSWEIGISKGTAIEEFVKVCRG